MDQPVSPPQGPQSQPPFQPQPRPQIHPRLTQNPLQKFSRKTWLLILGLVIIILAVLVGVSLVKQKQLPWIKGVYGPPTGLPSHPIMDSSLDLFAITAEPPEGDPYMYINVSTSGCCLTVTYTYDPVIDVWFQQAGDWELVIESQVIYPRSPYEICLTDFQTNHGYDPTADATVAVITTADPARGGGQYRNDAVVPPCEEGEPICGNNLVEGSEECDGTDDDACPGECQENCTCPSEPVCGDNLVGGSEECDGTDDDACPGECQENCTCPSEEPTATPTATPEPAGCGDSCTYNSDCDGDLICRDVEGEIKCVNEDCSFDDDCICGAEPTPTATPTSTPGQGAPEPTPTPTSLPKAEKPKELPPTASVQRTILGIVGGVILLLIGLAL